MSTIKCNLKSIDTMFLIFKKISYQVKYRNLYL